MSLFALRTWVLLVIFAESEQSTAIAVCRLDSIRSRSMFLMAHSRAVSAQNSTRCHFTYLALISRHSIITRCCELIRALRRKLTYSHCELTLAIIVHYPNIFHIMSFMTVTLTWFTYDIWISKVTRIRMTSLALVGFCFRRCKASLSTWTDLKKY